MNHFTSAKYWLYYSRLPSKAKKLADKSFALLRTDPGHKSLRLKKVGAFWSAQVGLNHHAVAKERPEGLIWFWIGTRDEYKNQGQKLIVYGAAYLAIGAFGHALDYFSNSHFHVTAGVGAMYAIGGLTLVCAGFFGKWLENHSN